MEEKKIKKSSEWTKKSQERLYFPAINVRIRQDDGTLYDSLLDAAALRKITPAEYLRRATREKLERDDEMK